MKTNQITIISITAVLLFTLAGCEPKGYLETKGEKLDHEKYTSRVIHWTMNGPIDGDGNPIELDEDGNPTW